VVGSGSKSERLGLASDDLCNRYCCTDVMTVLDLAFSQGRTDTYELFAGK